MMDEFEEFRCRAFSAGRAPIGYNTQETGGIETFRSRVREKQSRKGENSAGMDRLGNELEDLGFDHSPRSCSPTPKSPLAEGFHQQVTSKLQRARPSSLRYNRPRNKTGSLSPGLNAHHKRSQSCRRPRRTLHPDYNLDSSDDGGEMRPRTSSMPSKGNIRRPQSLKVRPTHSQTHTPVEGAQQDPCPFYRVRSFTSSSKGIIINTGDSFKRKKRLAVSDASVDSIDSCPGRMKHTWSTQSQGSRGSSVSSTVDADAPASHRVVILGAAGVGKTALIQQFKTSSDYMGNVDTGVSK